MVTHDASSVKPAVIFARVSTADQVSIPAQVEACRKALQAKEYAAAYVITVQGWSSLDLYSCPKFNELRQLISDHKVKAVAVLDRDRLEAQGLQRLIFLSELREAGIELIVCQGPQVIDGAEGQLVELALAMGKEKSVLRARQGSKDGLRYRATSKGLPVTYRPLFGYDWLKPTPEQPNPRLIPNRDYTTVKLIFDLLLDNWTFDRIIPELQERGIQSASGQATWNKTALSYMVHNPVYTGRFCALRKEAKEPVRRVISQTEKCRVNSSYAGKPESEWVYLPAVEVVNPPITPEQREGILEAIRQRMKLSSRNANREYLLRGFVVCDTHSGRGGQPRIYHGRPKNNTHYYVCPVGGDCNIPYIPGPVIEDYVKFSVGAMLGTQPDEFQRKLFTAQGSQTAELNTEIGNLRKRDEAIISKQAQLEDRFMSGVISQEVYDSLKARYDHEREGVKHRVDDVLELIASAQKQSDAIQTLCDLRVKMADRLSSGNMTDHEWRELFTAMNLRVHANTEEHRYQVQQEIAYFRGLDFTGEKKKFNPEFDLTIEVALQTNRADINTIRRIVSDVPGKDLHNNKIRLILPALRDTRENNNR